LYASYDDACFGYLVSQMGWKSSALSCWAMSGWKDQCFFRLNWSSNFNFGSKLWALHVSPSVDCLAYNQICSDL